MKKKEAMRTSVTDSLSKKKAIAEIFAPDRLVVESSLHQLSSINDSDLQFLKQSWAAAGKERRFDVVARLIKLSQENLRLDFSDIFMFCLNDSDARVRANAVDGLANEDGDQYVSPLLRLLAEDNSSQVKEAVIKALGKYALMAETGNLSGSYVQKTYLALLKVFEDGKTPSEMKHLALEAIAPYSMPRVKELIKDVYHSDEPGSKASAIRAMGHNCDQVWLTDLITELDNNDVEIRRSAVTAIGEIGEEAAFTHLLKLVEDEDVTVKEAVIMALVETGSESARQTLTKMAGSSQSRIRQAAKKALKELDFCKDLLFPDS
jgi:HEAT repeat protein